MPGKPGPDRFAGSASVGTPMIRAVATGPQGTSGVGDRQRERGRLVRACDEAVATGLGDDGCDLVASGHRVAVEMKAADIHDTIDACRKRATQVLIGQYDRYEPSGLLRAAALRPRM